MIFSLIAYSVCVLYFSTDFVIVYASLLIVFGAFKSGAGFEAIATGISAFRYISSTWGIRVFLALSWLGVMAAISNVKIAPILPFGLLFSFLWLRSFDGHLSGQKIWSGVNGLLPVIMIVSVGVFFLQFTSSLVFDISYRREYLFAFSVVVFLICLVALGDSKTNTISEIMHCSVSPLILFSLSSVYIDTNGLEFIFYRICEGLAQLSIFVLTASRKNSPLAKSVAPMLVVVCFFIFLIGIVISNYILHSGRAVIFGIFILFYYITAFVIVRYFSKWSIGFIFMALMLAISVNIWDSEYSQYILFFVPVYLFFISNEKKYLHEK